MKLKDYQGRIIELSDTSWEHIQEAHPEISLSDISAVLADPIEVRECPKQNFVELFYQVKIHPEGKQRFRVVVVKILKEGNFISTAMTTTMMKAGKTLFKKEEKQ